MAKSSNLPSFWVLTPAHKVRLPYAWSHFVGLNKTLDFGDPGRSLRMMYWQVANWGPKISQL